MNRAEHLAWAKERAQEYVNRGDLAGAVSSITSDLSKHPDLNSLAITLACGLGILEVDRGADAVRHWIEGFQ